MNVIETNVGNYLIDTKPYSEYNNLLEYAIKENHLEVVDKHNVDYYITFVYKNQPIYFCQLVNGGLYDDKVYNIGGLYLAPQIRQLLPVNDVISMWKNNLQIVFLSPVNAKLVFASRVPSKNKWHNIFIKMLGWNTNEKYYAVTEPRHLQRSWQKIYYSGDLDLLNIRSLNEEQYRMMFGKYFSRRSVCPELKNISSTDRILIVGDPESQVFTWISDNRPKASVEVICNIGQKNFNTSERMYEIDVKVSKSNLALCERKPIVVQQPESIYNVIYIGAPNVDKDYYRSYLVNNGLYIDDSTRKD